MKAGLRYMGGEMLMLIARGLGLLKAPQSLVRWVDTTGFRWTWE